MPNSKGQPRYKVGPLQKWKFLGRLIRYGELTPAALKFMYWLIDHLNGQTLRCDPGHDTLAREMNMSVQSVKRAQKEVVSKDIITVRTGGGHYRNTNKYEVNWDWDKKHGSGTEPGGPTGEPPTGAKAAPSLGPQMAPEPMKKAVKNEPIKNQREVRNTCTTNHALLYPSQHQIDWDGWVVWLHERHGIQEGDAWHLIMGAIERLEESGFTAKDAYEKVDVLFKVARKHHRTNPVRFLNHEIERLSDMKRGIRDSGDAYI